MRHDLPTGTVTFLFTDVEGSTRLLHELGAEAYDEALIEHRRLIREACAAEGGVEVDTQGDAFFFAFPTAPGAVAAAEAMTAALAQGPIIVRIGLHTGTPLVAEEGYIGSDVHRAARLAAAGHGGQVLVSSSTAQLVEFELADVGEHRLKDLSAPERIYQLGNSEFPALKSLYRTNLPIPATPFLGREQELGQVLDLLARDDVRLLTLTGPGGTGKTRLAAQAVGEVAENYVDGVWWIPLAALRDPALVLESAALTLGAKDDLASHIADQQLLLFFDNYEHVLEAAPALAPLLADCPNLRLVVTSRERLRLQGEHVYPVPTLDESDAVRLFAERARALDPAFTLDHAVAALCGWLDNLPLAVELAAARTSALTPAQILERLSGRLDLLTGGKDVDERQQTLRATIEWSYDLLSAEEQQLFARLSVFVGGCTLEAAEEVAAADISTLESLVDKNLVRFTAGRYWMLETIRQFAAEALSGSADVDELQRRHTEHYVALAKLAAPELNRSDAEVWLDRLENDHDNLRAVLERCGATGASEVALELTVNMYTFWRLHDHLAEGRRWLEHAAEGAAGEPTPRRAEALGSAAELARLQGDYEGATAHAELSLSIARECADDRDAGWALNTLAGIAGEQGDLDRGAELYEEAIAVLRRADERRGVGIATSGLGYLALSSGDFDRAVPLCDEALEILRATGDASATALALLNVGLVSLVRGRSDRAENAYSECLQIAARLGHRDFVAYAEGGLAALAVRQGRMDRALRLLASAATLREAIGAPLDPAERDIQEQTLEAIRSAFPPKTIEAAHEAARLLSLEDVVNYALSDED
jgi:predicted ATPase